jgi:hypothetical protein
VTRSRFTAKGHTNSIAINGMPCMMIWILEPKQAFDIEDIREISDVSKRRRRTSRLALA